MKQYSIEEAFLYLRDNLDEIHTVEEWAEALGYSRSHFTSLIKLQFDSSPYKIIRREKFKRIRELVYQKPDRKGIIIARKVGLSDEKALYKFLSTHFNTTLTMMRERAKKKY